MRFVLANALIWPGDGREFVGHIVVCDERIESVASGVYAGGLPTIDCTELALSPGLIDLMALGGFGMSILRNDPLAIAHEYLRLGITSCQFCIATLPPETTRQIAANVSAAMRDTQSRHTRADVLGLYLEGPFQQPELTGASLREHAWTPTHENVARLLDLGPAVTMINVAPGLPHAPHAARCIRDAGKVVAMAHSNAAADAVFACLDAGTTVLGHAWDNNAGRTGDSGVQQPTLEHVALTDDRVGFIHVICDGTHVHPVIVRMTLRCRGLETLCLVTDAVIRAGCPDGPYTNDDGRTFSKAGGVGRTDTGWLAGSALLLPDHLRTFVRMTGSPPASAIRTVTLNPAASLNLNTQIGLLAAGLQADIVAWDPATLLTRRVWKRGQEVANVSSFAEIALD